MTGNSILLGFVFFSIELRWLGKPGYRHRGWGDKWVIATGTYGEGRFFVIGPLMIEFLGNKSVVWPYIRIFS